MEPRLTAGLHSSESVGRHGGEFRGSPRSERCSPDGHVVGERESCAGESLEGDTLG